MKRREGFYSDEWWIEFIERELEPSHEQDMNLLAKGSKADREILDGYRKIKEVVKSTDDVYLSEDGHYYEDLQNRIMAAVENSAEPPISLADRRSRKPGRAFFSTLFLGLVFVVITMISLQSETTGIEGTRPDLNTAAVSEEKVNFRGTSKIDGPVLQAALDARRAVKRNHPRRERPRDGSD